MVRQVLLGPAHHLDHDDVVLGLLLHIVDQLEPHRVGAAPETGIDPKDETPAGPARD